MVNPTTPPQTHDDISEGLRGKFSGRSFGDLKLNSRSPYLYRESSHLPSKCISHPSCRTQRTALVDMYGLSGHFLKISQFGVEEVFMTNEERNIQRKLKVLQHAEKIGNARKACRYFGIGRSSFYRWRDAYQKHGEAGLKNAKSIPKNPANQTPPEIVEKILYLRRKYHLGPIRIVWYLERYHSIKISDAGGYRILKRNGLNRLSRGTRMRKLHTKRYQKQVLGHHIQVDVKFLTLKGKSGEKVRRFQFTAIDDATRVRALKIYEKHTRASAVDFIDHIIEKFPFRIREIRPDNGREFQAKSRWHVEDLGIRHAYIKRGSPAQRQSRALTPIRSADILPTSQLQR